MNIPSQNSYFWQGKYLVLAQNMQIQKARCLQKKKEIESEHIYKNMGQGVQANAEL